MVNDILSAESQVKVIARTKPHSCFVQVVDKKQREQIYGCASPAIFVVSGFGPSGPASRRKRSLTWSSARDVNLFLTKKDDFYANSAHRSAHGDRNEPYYAARFNLTTGRCRRFL